jgi:hypothetical protein
LNFLVGRLSRLVTYPTMLLNRHGDALLRIKGTLNVADAATPVAVHAVQHLVHTPRHLEAWPDADRLSRLVFIARGGGRSGGMPPDAALAGGHPVFSALCSTSGVFRLRSNCV